MQVHGSKQCSMNQGGVTTMELVSPLHLFSIPVRPKQCVLKQRDGKRMANFSTVSKHVITLGAIVVTEANVVQPCIDPVKPPSQIIQKKKSGIIKTELFWYEARQTPKEHSKDGKIWKVYDRAQSLRALVYFALRNKNVSIGQHLSQKKTAIVFCAQLRPKTYTHITKNFVGFITIPLYYLLQNRVESINLGDVEQTCWRNRV